MWHGPSPGSFVSARGDPLVNVVETIQFDASHFFIAPAVYLFVLTGCRTSEGHPGAPRASPMPPRASRGPSPHTPRASRGSLGASHVFKMASLIATRCRFRSLGAERGRDFNKSITLFDEVRLTTVPRLVEFV